MKCMFNFQGPLGENSLLKKSLDELLTYTHCERPSGNPKNEMFTLRLHFFGLDFGQKTPTFKKVNVANLLFM